ncbi:MAG: response regulator [Candidatus Methylacidiphilales bacterium]
MPSAPSLDRYGKDGASRIAPRPDDTQETLKLPALAPLIPSLTAPLVLIADDEVAVRKSIRLVLEISGYRVEEVGRGMQVLACLHHNPAVVLLDINMPGLNGVECLSEMRKRRPLLKVIIVSGEIDSQLSPLTAMGAFAYVPKPVDAYKLIAAIKRAIDDDASAPPIRYNIDASVH